VESDKKARGIKCLSNMKQIMVGYTIYSYDNKDDMVTPDYSATGNR
jgi:hypothetical protein